jgi:GH24 family phage-related lysozyme (muramidase)
MRDIISEDATLMKKTKQIFKYIGNQALPPLTPGVGYPAESIRKAMEGRTDRYGVKSDYWWKIIGNIAGLKTRPINIDVETYKLMKQSSRLWRMYDIKQKAIMDDLSLTDREKSQRIKELQEERLRGFNKIWEDILDLKSEKKDDFEPIENDNFKPLSKIKDTISEFIVPSAEAGEVEENIKKEEGFRKKFYKDVTGTSIGYGHRVSETYPPKDKDIEKFKKLLKDNNIKYQLKDNTLIIDKTAAEKLQSLDLKNKSDEFKRRYPNINDDIKNILMNIYYSYSGRGFDKLFGNYLRNNDIKGLVDAIKRRAKYFTTKKLGGQTKRHNKVASQLENIISE